MTLPMRHILLLAAMFSVLSLLSSCNILGPAAIMVTGPPKIQKVFDLPRDPVTVVLIEDTSSPPQIRDTRMLRRIAEAATDELVSKGVVRTAIQPGPIHMMSMQPSERQTPIVDLARRVEAEQIIYAEIVGFSLSPDGQSYTPTAELRVRVVKVIAGESGTTGERVWPAEPKGHAMIAGGESITGFRPRDAAEVRQAEEELAKLTGQRLAQLFYDRERDSTSRRRP